MGFKELEIKLPANYTADELMTKVYKTLRISNAECKIIKKSLDAREKHNIRWILRLQVISDELTGGAPEEEAALKVERKKRAKTAIVVGSGPAGFFAAYLLQSAGFNTTLIEQGSGVPERHKAILNFESGGELDEMNNYGAGEGGAGTFSDGKLTSRTKTISLERKFLYDAYIRAGAPKEIAYLAYPHVGSDILRKVIVNLRKEFENLGGKFIFNTKIDRITTLDGTVTEVIADRHIFRADYFIFAPGHSSYDTYRLLSNSGVEFKTKPFAIGCRVEHPQELVNLAQWGQKSLPGVKAAEYRLTFNGAGFLPVYSFCMCPGGKVVPATNLKGLNFVNGMSDYQRKGEFANSAIVAMIDPQNYLPENSHPLMALDWLAGIERKFYESVDGYRAPAMSVTDFISGKASGKLPKSSFPLGLSSVDLTTLLPTEVVSSMQAALKQFDRQFKGFGQGVLAGLESKTSSPLQVTRDEKKRVAGWTNLFITGEGSGLAGGIVSSAADGMKAAMQIIEENS